MKTLFAVTISLILSCNCLGQWLYFANSNGSIYKINLLTCKDTLLVQGNGTAFMDIAMCPDDSNTIYGVTNTPPEMYKIDVKTGSRTLICPAGNPMYTFCPNALVCDGKGHLYAADKYVSQFYEYDLGTNTWKILGSLGGYTSSGDLTYYNGQLYNSTNSDSLITISLNPLTVHAVSKMDISNVWGVNTIKVQSSICGSTYKMLASDNSGNAYWVDPATGKSTPACAGIAGAADGIYGATSTNETVPPEVLLSTTPPPPVCPGKNVTLAVNGKHPFSYSWNPGAMTDSIVTITTPQVNTTYTVTGTDSKGCTATATVVVTVYHSPLCAPTSLPAQCGFSNGKAMANAGGGTSPYNYSWSTGSTDSNISNLSSGVYTVTITDKNSCTNTASVNVAMSTGLSDTHASVNIKCFGGNNGSASVTTAGGVSPYVYSWNNNASSSSINNLVAGTYICIVKDNSGNCADTIKIIITQPSPLVVKAASSSPVCAGACDGKANVVVSGATSPYAYSWSNSASADSISALCAGNYSIHVSDANSCSHDTSLVITAPAPLAFVTKTTPTTCNINNGTAAVTASGGTPGYSYSWDKDPATVPNLANVASGKYILTVTDAKGCKDTVSVLITNSAPFLLSTAPAKLLCFGDKNGSLSATVTGNSSPYTYSWSNNAGASATVNNLAAGKYAVTVTDVNGCQATAADSVTQPAALALSATGQVICAGGSVTLSSVSSGGTSPYSYAWNNTGTDASYSVTPAATTVYTEVISDANGCVISDTAIVTVIPIPQAAFSGMDVCVGVPTAFKDSSTGVINSSVWNFGDGTSGDSPLHTYSKAGTYTVTLTVSNSGCLTTVAHVVNVYPFPKADFSANPQPASILDPVITFTDLSNGGVSGSWDFGDGTKDNYSPGKDPVHTYPNENIPGGETYRVKLNIVNEHGCPDTISKLVHIDPEWTFYVPNTFTPNGDGKNDIFFGTGIGIIEKEMWIFDRWGNQIFHTNDLYGGWDGKVQDGSSNEVAQEDTYVWLITIKEVFLNTHRLIGHVNIIK